LCPGKRIIGHKEILVYNKFSWPISSKDAGSMESIKGLDSVGQYRQVGVQPVGQEELATLRNEPKFAFTKNNRYSSLKV
jgi:hypothetical protein